MTEGDRKDSRTRGEGRSTERGGAGGRGDCLRSAAAMAAGSEDCEAGRSGRGGRGSTEWQAARGGMARSAIATAGSLRSTFPRNTLIFRFFGTPLRVFPRNTLRGYAESADTQPLTARSSQMLCGSLYL